MRGPATEIRLLALALVLTWIWWDASESEMRFDALGIVLVIVLGLALATLHRATSTWNAGRATMMAAVVALAFWSFLSMTWADFPGVAWTGANRMLVYAAVFALFSAWPSSIRERDLLVGFVALCVGATGLAVAIQLAVASPPGGLVGGGRLTSPLSYANGNAALFLLGTIPAVTLAASPERRAWIRAACLGSATLLTGLAVLTQSRGWLFGLPLAVAIVLVCARRRLRLGLALVIAGVAVAPAVPTLNGVFGRYWNDRPSFEPELHRAIVFLLVAAGASAMIGFAWGIADGRIRLGERTRRNLGIAAVTCLILAVAGAASVASVAVGDPQAWVKSRWKEFTGGFTSTVTGSRLTSTVGSGRYELWQTAVQEFADHPIIGIGADNFAAPHLLRRSTGSNQPLHPHSTPLRLLSQLGLVGAGLFALGIGIALWRGFLRRRAAGAAGGDIVGVSLAVFLFWLVQGSVDVLWEIPALGGLAFAMLGLASSPVELSQRGNDAVSRRGARLIVPGAVIVLAGAAVSLALTGLSDAYVRSAQGVSSVDQVEAYRRFETAASLKPLSGVPFTQEGLVALAADDFETAHRAFAKAISREPKNWYPYMQLGLVAGATKDYASATRFLERAHELNPRDALVQIATKIVDARGMLDPGLFTMLYEEGFYIAGSDWLIANYFQIPPFTDA